MTAKCHPGSACDETWKYENGYMYVTNRCNATFSYCGQDNITCTAPWTKSINPETAQLEYTYAYCELPVCHNTFSPSVGTVNRQTQTRSCNPVVCDADCTVSAWSPFSTCSAACRFSAEYPFQSRSRKVIAEAVLWTSWRHRGWLKAKSNGEILMVDPKQFSELMHLHPKPWYLGMHYGVDFVNYLNRINLND
jgi:hypothetical protein